MNSIIIRIGMDGIWQNSIFFGMVLCVLSIALRRRSIFYTLWGYVLLSALYMFEYPPLQAGSMQAAFMLSSARTFSEVLLITCAVFSFKQKHIRLLFDCLAIIEVGMLLYQNSGLFVAPSFDLAFLALYAGFAPTCMIFVILGMVLTHHCTTAKLILLGYAFSDFIATRNYLTRAMIAGFGLIILALAYFQSGHMFDGSERILYYTKFMHYYWDTHTQIPYLYHTDYVQRLFGFGPGSFIWISSMMESFKGTIFLQMHCDWLQILFELGIVGFMLVVAAFGKALHVARKSPLMFGAVLGCGIFALTYHPLRFMPSMMLVAYIFREVWEES